MSTTTPPAFTAGRIVDPLPLFVYGTLLPGQRLAGHLAGHVAATRPASVAGRLHWHRSGEYPVMVDDTASTTWGMVVDVRHDPGLLAWLVTEELACGYEARWLAARDPDGQALGPALAFTWPWGPDSLGPEIAGGRFATVA